MCCGELLHFQLVMKHLSPENNICYIDTNYYSLIWWGNIFRFFSYSKRTPCHENAFRITVPFLGETTGDRIDILVVVSLNTRLNKQPTCRWFATPNFQLSLSLLVKSYTARKWNPFPWAWAIYISTMLYLQTNCTSLQYCKQK